MLSLSLLIFFKNIFKKLGSVIEKFMILSLLGFAICASIDLQYFNFGCGLSVPAAEVLIMKRTCTRFDLGSVFI